MLLPPRTGVQFCPYSLALPGGSGLPNRATLCFQKGCYREDFLEPHYKPSQQVEVPRVPRETCPPPQRGHFRSGKRCREGAEELLPATPPVQGFPLLHNTKVKGLGQAWTPVFPALLLLFKMILTSTVWCSLNEWRASQSRQCQGLKKVCPCQGLALMGVRHWPSLPHTPPLSQCPSPGPVPCEGPENPQPVSCCWVLGFVLSSFQQLLLLSDVGESGVIAFGGKG